MVEKLRRRCRDVLGELRIIESKIPNEKDLVKQHAKLARIHLESILNLIEEETKK